MGWGGSTKNQEKDDKGSRVRVEPLFCSRVPSLYKTSLHYSLSDLKLDVYVPFVDWFFGSKRVCCCSWRDPVSTLVIKCRAPPDQGGPAHRRVPRGNFPKLW